MLSIIIPSHDDIYLHKTIDSIIENASGEIEIIPVLDGYTPGPFRDDPRIRPIFHSKNKGMREAINTGVRASTGDYLMRTDEHCMFGERFDIIILDTIQDHWIVTPRRYYLDPEKWEVIDKPPVDYEKLKITNSKYGKKFAGIPCVGLSKNPANLNYDIDETMSMQGSVWFMKKTWWQDVIRELQTEGYGPLLQDSHEMVFKTWRAGGKLVVNKLTWFAHKDVHFKRTHQNGTPENPANPEQSFAYALEQWGNYYQNEVVPEWNLQAS
jgi:glycosyltransferase involved in cell wall biosynthesis